MVIAKAIARKMILSELFRQFEKERLENKHLVLPDVYSFEARNIRFKGTMPKDKVFVNIDNDTLSVEVNVYGFSGHKPNNRNQEKCFIDLSSSVVGSEKKVTNDVRTRTKPIPISQVADAYQYDFFVVLFETKERKLLERDNQRGSCSYQIIKSEKYVEVYYELSEKFW